MKSRTVLMLAVVCCCTGLGLAQSTDGASSSQAAPPSAAESVVPRLIRFDGTVTGAQKGGFTLTFSLYEFEEGGTPLWSETQQVQPDEQGRYTVLLGVTAPGGLPLDLFTTGKARWLGVQPQLEGVGEQPRVLLVWTASAPAAQA